MKRQLYSKGVLLYFCIYSFFCGRECDVLQQSTSRSKIDPLLSKLTASDILVIHVCHYPSHLPKS